jgi:hypothetical protein
VGRKGANLAPVPCGNGTFLNLIRTTISTHVALEHALRYSASMKPTGLFRERNGWGAQHSVRVKYDERQELDLAEDRYRERGYQPPFDKLPWKDDPANDA